MFSRCADALPASAAAESKAPSPPTRDEIDPFEGDAPAPQQGRLLDTPGSGLTEKCPQCHAPAGAKRHATGCRANLGAFQ